MAFNEGENCIPYNHAEIKRDLELYYEFYYYQYISIEEYRCLPFGISVRFLKGLPMQSNMTKNYFVNNYLSLMTRECDGWSYIPFTL